VPIWALLDKLHGGRRQAAQPIARPSRSALAPACNAARAAGRRSSTAHPQVVARYRKPAAGGGAETTRRDAAPREELWPPWAVREGCWEEYTADLREEAEAHWGKMREVTDFPRGAAAARRLLHLPAGCLRRHLPRAAGDNLV